MLLAVLVCGLVLGFAITYGRIARRFTAAGGSPRALDPAKSKVVQDQNSPERRRVPPPSPQLPPASAHVPQTKASAPASYLLGAHVGRQDRMQATLDMMAGPGVCTPRRE